MYCNTLQRTAKYCNTLPHTATHCNTRGVSQISRPRARGAKGEGAVKGEGISRPGVSPPPVTPPSSPTPPSAARDPAQSGARTGVNPPPSGDALHALESLHAFV